MDKLMPVLFVIGFVLLFYFAMWCIFTLSKGSTDKLFGWSNKIYIFLIGINLLVWLHESIEANSYDLTSSTFSILSVSIIVLLALRISRWALTRTKKSDKLSEWHRNYVHRNIKYLLTISLAFYPIFNIIGIIYYLYFK